MPDADPCVHGYRLPVLPAAFNEAGAPSTLNFVGIFSRIHTRQYLQEAIYTGNIADLGLLLGQRARYILVQDAGDQRLVWNPLSQCLLL